ncbi:hypothetical protein ACWCQN_38080 [Streptomyces sp. NPDC001984]
MDSTAPGPSYTTIVGVWLGSPVTGSRAGCPAVREIRTVGQLRFQGGLGRREIQGHPLTPPRLG